METPFSLMCTYPAPHPRGTAWPSPSCCRSSPLQCCRPQQTGDGPEKQHKDRVVTFSRSCPGWFSTLPRLRPFCQPHLVRGRQRGGWVEEGGSSAGQQRWASCTHPSYDQILIMWYELDSKETVGVFATTQEASDTCCPRL